MKISVEAQDVETKLKTSIEICDDSDVHEVIDSFCGLLVSYGFHYESVKSGIISKGDEYCNEK